MGGVGTQSGDNESVADADNKSDILSGYSSFFADPAPLDTVTSDAQTLHNHVSAQSMRGTLQQSRDAMEAEHQFDHKSNTSTRPNSVLLLTGANFSGKSVYLRQVNSSGASRLHVLM